MPGHQRLLQHLRRCFGIGIAAHENIDGGETPFGPSVNRDMRLGQKKHTGDPVSATEMMERIRQNGRACNGGSGPQSRLQPDRVVQKPSSEMIDQKMCSGRMLSNPAHARVLMPCTRKRHAVSHMD